MNQPAKYQSRQEFQQAVDWLGKHDAILGKLTGRFGQPPFWVRPPGFPTLVLIILEQQVSLASARAAFDKLKALNERLTPETFLEHSAEDLLAAGFSRQKRRYCRLLADAILSGGLDLESLESMDDKAVFQSLTALTGIGPWTAQIYLLMALRRKDVWPAGDLALQVALKNVLDLPDRPNAEETRVLAANWSPHRAAAARVLWHFYLSA